MKKYDLNLGKWGPYNKEYLGILHIADENTGTTFNVECFCAVRTNWCTTVTVGFEVIVENSVWNKEKTSAEINCISLNKNTKILVCMKAGEYSATVNGKVCEMRKITDGAFEISLNKEKNHIVIS